MVHVYSRYNTVDDQDADISTRFQQSPVIWTTGGTTPHALAVRATLDAFAGPTVKAEQATANTDIYHEKASER